MKKLFFVLMVGALFASCEKSISLELDSNEAIELQSMSSEINVQNPNETSNDAKMAEVIRTEYDWGFKFVDDKTFNVAWVNVNFEEFCGGERDRDFVDVQQVLIQEKDGSDRVINLWKGQDVQVSVYEYDYPSCTEYFESAPLFEGTGSFVWTDNDANPDGSNINSYGFRLHGDGISIIFHALYEDGETTKSRTSIKLK